MRCSTILASALSASTIMAAPTWPSFNKDAAMPGQLETVSEWFNMLAGKVQAGRAMAISPVCDMSKVQLPSSKLPPPGAGLSLKHVAVGRGTQNYTCEGLKDTEAPVLVGAVATLYNASCMASAFPDLLSMVPGVALKFAHPLGAKAGSDSDSKLGPVPAAVSGHHYFIGATPFFTLDTPNQKLGEVPTSKLNATDAPRDAPKGQQGEPAVGWLKLAATDAATGGLREVYRVGTAGGSSPKTCKGLPDFFEVQYSAEYWFYSGESN